MGALKTRQGVAGEQVAVPGYDRKGAPVFPPPRKSRDKHQGLNACLPNQSRIVLSANFDAGTREY